MQYEILLLVFQTINIINEQKTGSDIYDLFKEIEAISFNYFCERNRHLDSDDSDDEDDFDTYYMMNAKKWFGSNCFEDLIEK